MALRESEGGIQTNPAMVGGDPSDYGGFSGFSGFNTRSSSVPNVPNVLNEPSGLNGPSPGAGSVPKGIDGNGDDPWWQPGLVKLQQFQPQSGYNRWLYIGLLMLVFLALWAAVSAHKVQRGAAKPGQRWWNGVGGPNGPLNSLASWRGSWNSNRQVGLTTKQQASPLPPRPRGPAAGRCPGVPASPPAWRQQQPGIPLSPFSPGSTGLQANRAPATLTNVYSSKCSFSVASMPRWQELKTAVQARPEWGIRTSEVDCAQPGVAQSDGRCRLVGGYPTWFLAQPEIDRYTLIGHTAPLETQLQLLGNAVRQF